MKNKTISIFLLALASTIGFSQATFQGIGYLAGGAANASKAYGVSDDGSVVVGYSSSPAGNQAARWTLATGIQGLGILAGGLKSQARRVSGDGLVVVGESGSTIGTQSVRWTAGGGMIAMGDIPGGLVNSDAVVASHDGSVIAGIGNNASSFIESYRWTQAGGMVGLGFLPAAPGESHTFGISSDGSIICGYSTTTKGVFEAYRWTQATGMVGLGDLTGGTFDSRAYGMSGNGEFIVGRSDGGGYEAFKWSNATQKMVRLGFLTGYATESRGRDVTDDGNVVVGRSETSLAMKAFVWTTTKGMLDFRTYLVQHGATGLTGWILEEAYAVTPDGRFVVGYGIDPTGAEQGWIAKMPPRLSTLTLAAKTAIGGKLVAGTAVIGFSGQAANVSLLSANPAVATVPTSVQVVAGQTSANFNVSTHPVSVKTAVAIQASFDGETRSLNLVVLPPALKSITLASTTCQGGALVATTAKLTGAASTGGITVTLGSSNTAVATVPASVLIPAGSLSAKFNVTTKVVASTKTVTITGTYLTVSKTASLTVNP